MTNKEKLRYLFKEAAVKSKSDQLTSKLKSKVDPRIFGDEKIDIKHRGIKGISHYAGKDSLDVDSEDYRDQRRKAKINAGLGTAGSLAGGVGVGKLVSKLTGSKGKGALAGLGAGAAGLAGTSKYNKNKLLNSLSEGDQQGLQEILKHRNKVVADDIGQAQKARLRSVVGIPGIAGMYNSRPVRPKTASLEKLALNRGEKEYMKKLKANPDKVRDILGEKSIELNNLDRTQSAKLNDYVRGKLRSDVNSANRAASMSKKKLPKGVKTEHKQFLGKDIPFTGKKKTTYGTGKATNSYARETHRQNLKDAIQRNKRKQNFKSIATPGTAAGGVGGYLLSNKMVDDNKAHSKKKKALGTLGGAVAGNLIGKKLRGKI